MSSSPTSRRARAACATSTRSSGSANMSTGCAASAELVDVGPALAARSLRQFQPRRALPAGRCAATSTSIAGRAEDRLTFDYQREIAGADELCRPARQDRRSSASCSYYFLQAKTVGDLTGVFLAHLDEQFARRGQPLRPARASAAGRASSRASCSTAAGSPLPGDDFFARGSGAADRDVRAGRPARARNPSAGDARGRAATPS